MTKADKVVEAAMRVMQDWNCYDKRVELANTVTEYKAEQEEAVDDYKWLAMDRDGSTSTFTQRPVYSTYGIWDVGEWNQVCRISPSFLRPGQMWERVCISSGVPFDTHSEQWNGSWWRKVEDHSKDNTPVEKCIVKGCTNTSENGKVINGLCSVCYEILVSGKPQPTESILSVIGKETITCENFNDGEPCDCLNYCSVDGEERLICLDSMVVDAQYGANGCIYNKGK